MVITQASTVSEIKFCADIWLQASIAAHTFIAPEFWKNQYTAMCEHYLPASEVYALKKQTAIIGFAAVHQGSLAALFISPEWWGKGAGSRLLQHVQQRYPELSLSVYAQNSRAACFYRKHGFSIVREQVCSHTEEPELVMHWKNEDAAQHKLHPLSDE